MRKLSVQELEVLQETIVSEGWFPIREDVGTRVYSATYEIDEIKYVIHKDSDTVEAWKIE
jgi:hypothetical protein